jgi:hypothetical protein
MMNYRNSLYQSKSAMSDDSVTVGSFSSNGFRVEPATNRRS